MNDYYLLSEDIGNLLFIKWANLKGIFTEMERLPIYSRVDWICQAKTGLKVNCELKVRDNLDWNTIFIEPGKWNYLVNKWNSERIIPFYINMCKDTVLVFDLRKVGKPTVKHNIKIWDEGALCYKCVDRYELPTSKAYKYINGKKQS